MVPPLAHHCFIRYTRDTARFYWWNKRFEIRYSGIVLRLRNGWLRPGVIGLLRVLRQIVRPRLCEICAVPTLGHLTLMASVSGACAKV
jgi:hypothetical protein